MRSLLRLALIGWLGLPLLAPAIVVADTGNNALTASAGTYYVTQVGAGSIARVTVSVTGVVKVESGYVSGLPGDGPDSAVFASDGTLLASNFSAGSISRIDVSTRKILTVQVNKVAVMPIADLAYDPSSNAVWGITYSGTGPTAIVRVDLSSGATTTANPDSLSDMGGVAITETGSRVFVSSHDGTIAEIDRSGRVVRKVTVQGSPDGLSYDPSTGNLFAAGCGGICELATGGAGGTKLTYVRTFDAVDGDGIAADGKGHVYVAMSTCGALCRPVLATDKAVTVTDDVPAADDVVPLTGAGAGGGCQVLSSCFDGAGAAGLAAAGVGTMLFIGAAGWSALRTTTPLMAHSHASAAAASVDAHGMVAAAPSHTVHPLPGQGASPPQAEPSSHLQEESGDKLLEAGGAGMERAVGGAEVEALGGAEASSGAEAGGSAEAGAARFARDEKEEHDDGRPAGAPEPPASPPEPPAVPQPPDVPAPPEHPPAW